MSFKIVYTKTAIKDIPKLKAAHLDGKAKALIDVIRENPYQNPPPYEKLVGDMNAATGPKSLMYRTMFGGFITPTAMVLVTCRT